MPTVAMGLVSTFTCKLNVSNEIVTYILLNKTYKNRP